MTQADVNLLKTWFGMPNAKFKLLYKGSRDGFFSQVFHSKCDNQGATLTIIRSEHGKVFGGYASRPWSSP